jgi:hypothetical protein
MSGESLGSDERQLLESEMTVFAADIVTDRIRQAGEDWNLRGMEESEAVDISGNIDGIPYRVVIPGKAHKKEK